MTLESDHRCCECSFWAKYVLFGFNFLVWVAGIVLIAIGIWARLQKEGLDPLDHLVTDPAYILIAVGVVMFFISFFGCIGALRENVTLLKIFCIVVVIIFILQVIAGVLAFVFVDSIEKQVLDYMKHSLEHYDDNADINDLVDQIQKQYKCCGAASYNDWEVNFYYNCSSTAVSRCGVPSSCCRQLGNSGVQCGYNSRRHGEQYANAVIYITGCIHPLMTVFQDNLVIIGLLAFCVGFIEGVIKWTEDRNSLRTKAGLATLVSFIILHFFTVFGYPSSFYDLVYCYIVFIVIIILVIAGTLFDEEYNAEQQTLKLRLIVMLFF